MMASGSERKRILIVEDSEEMQSIYKSMFEGKEDKYEIETVDDARVGFKKLEGEKFDLIILDMIMEPMDGEMFFSCASADEKIMGVPILIVSVLHPDSVEHLKKIRDFEFLQKPIKKDQLFERINSILA